MPDPTPEQAARAAISAATVAIRDETPPVLLICAQVQDGSYADRNSKPADPFPPALEHARRLAAASTALHAALGDLQAIATPPDA